MIFFQSCTELIAKSLDPLNFLRVKQKNQNVNIKEKGMQPTTSIAYYNGTFA
jgi:hypothetical protein